jgi:drug/metabolite transporter (DMT)-like permease
MSLLATAIYYFAFAKGTALLPSSIAGLLWGAIPLFTFICAWLFLSEEHIILTKAAGVALGFLGVLLIARPWSSSGAIDILGVVYMLVGSLSVGCSFVYARRFITPLKLPGRGFDDIPDRARHDLPLPRDQSPWNWSRV